MRRRAFEAAKFGTGALCQSGSSARPEADKPPSADRSGSPSRARIFSLRLGSRRDGFRLTPTDRRPVPDQNCRSALRRVDPALFGPLGPFGGVAADFRSEMDDVNEFIRLPPQFIRHHGRLCGVGGDDGHADALALDCFDKGAEIAIAGKKHDMVKMLGHLHGVDGEFNVHVSFDLAAAEGIHEFFGRLRYDRVAIIVEPVDEGRIEEYS